MKANEGKRKPLSRKAVITAAVVATCAAATLAAEAIPSAAALPTTPQTDTTTLESHLAFKGVEIKGTREAFETRLAAKGFHGGGTMTGTLAGYDVRATIHTTKKTHTAYMVTAWTNTSLTWDEAEGNYELFRRNLLFKYGVPESETETFASPYAKGDGYEIRAYQTGNAERKTTWTTDKGKIILEMSPNAKGLCLRITYIDGRGALLEHAEASELFEEDL